MSEANEHPIIVDPEFKNLIPPLSPEEREGLDADVLRDGCLTPLLVWRTNEGDILLDGYNRLEACQKHGLPFEVEAVPEIASREDAMRFMISLQCHRRNLNEAQRAVLASRRANLAKGGDRRSEVFKSPIGDLKQLDAAELFNVGKRSVERARQVLEKGTPELARLVTEGKVAVSAAADVAGLPKAEQAKIVAGGAETVIAASREIRQQRKCATQEPVNPESAAPADPEALLPCAHCGSPAKYETFFDILRGYLHYVTCTNESCGIQTPSRKKKDEVQAVWNKRA